MLPICTFVYEMRYVVNMYRSRRRLDFKYLDFQIGQFFCPQFWVRGTPVYVREKMFANIGIPMKPCLKVTGTSVKTCWNVYGRSYFKSSLLCLWYLLSRCTSIDETQYVVNMYILIWKAWSTCHMHRDVFCVAWHIHTWHRSRIHACVTKTCAVFRFARFWSCWGRCPHKCYCGVANASDKYRCVAVCCRLMQSSWNVNGPWVWQWFS